MTVRSARVVHRGRTLVAGTARGAAMVLDQPLSLWGGMDPVTGRLIDRHHPQLGAELAGRIVVMPSGRGSSSSSAVLAETVRIGTTPAAFVLLNPDPIVALGAVVAAELYGRRVPVVSVDETVYREIRTADEVAVQATDEGAVLTVERVTRSRAGPDAPRSAERT